MNAYNPPCRQPDILASWPSDDLQWAQDEFIEWQREGIRGLRECDNNPREDADFDEWLGQMSQPHIKDCERFRAAKWEAARG